MAPDGPPSPVPSQAGIEIVFDPHVAIALIVLVLALAIVVILTTIPIEKPRDRR